MQAHHNHSPMFAYAYQKATHNYNAEYYTACKKRITLLKMGCSYTCLKNNIPEVQARLSW